MHKVSQYLYELIFYVIFFISVSIYLYLLLSFPSHKVVKNDLTGSQLFYQYEFSQSETVFPRFKLQQWF